MFSFLKSMFEPAPDAVASPAPVASTPAVIVGLDRAIHAAAPQADIAIWIPALTPWMLKSQITSARRVAAFCGECSVEAGPGFRSLSENLIYTHPERLCAVYGRQFPTLSSAQPYVNNPQALANKVYAGRLGNTDADDGFKFRGGGLIQVTGRTNYAAFSAWAGKSVDEAADWIRTPDGAAASACWYWSTNHLNALADAWAITAITRAINGPALEGAAQRLAAANAALKAIGG